MDHPQLGEASLTATVKPVWIPPTSPYSVEIYGSDLNITRFADGVQTLREVYHWSHWREYVSILYVKGCEVKWPYNPFPSKAERTNPWALRLSRQDIRLFALELDHADEITGTLLAFERSKCPPYSALSYVCGQGSYDQEIYVNGGRLFVKPNLLAALKQFKSCAIRSVREEKVSFIQPQDKFCWLWVDAMSINQADATEKAEQIGEMHHVYREATRVTACLGYLGSEFGCITRIMQWARGVRNPEEAPWPAQLELVEQLREFDIGVGDLLEIFDVIKGGLQWHIDNEEHGWQMSKDRILGFDEDVVVATPIPSEHPFFEGMLQILEHEWFSRLWAYQEYSLAFACLEYLVEDHTVPWRTFADVETFALELERHWYRHSRSMIRRTESLIRRRDYEHPVNFFPENTPSLWSLLEVSCQRKATVKSDHVFAIMGLMKPETRSRILVDYSRSDASVFMDAFEIAINHEGNGLGLTRCWERLAFIPSITPGLPSWCPDLANQSQVGTARSAWTEFLDDTSHRYDSFPETRVCRAEKSLHIMVMKADVVAQVVRLPCPSIGEPPDSDRLDWEDKFAGLLGTWFLRVHSTLGSTDGQDCMPTFEPGLDALLWLCLSQTHGFSREDMMEEYLPKCSSIPHDCSFRRLSRDPGWCFRTTIMYTRLAKSLRGNVFHSQHQRLGEHYDEGCSMCNLLRGPKVLAVANRWGVHIDRLTCNPDRSECRLLTPLEEENLLAGLLNIVGSLGLLMYGMYIFKTAAGRYGYSPRYPSVGDHVCVVPGGQLLHIISADTSRYVGVASVHGLMGDDIVEQDLFPDPEGRFEEVVLT
jgi:hypothetical protein